MIFFRQNDIVTNFFFYRCLAMPMAYLGGRMTDFKMGIR